MELRVRRAPRLSGETDLTVIETELTWSARIPHSPTCGRPAEASRTSAETAAIAVGAALRTPAPALTRSGGLAAHRCPGDAPRMPRPRLIIAVRKLINIEKEVRTMRTRVCSGGVPGAGGPATPRWLRVVAAAGLLGSVLVGLDVQPAAAATNGFRVFFQDNDNVLAEYSSGATVYRSTLGMDPGTSPSSALLTDGSYEVVFQANNHFLAFDHFGGGILTSHNGMDPASSPAIAGLANGGWVTVFQANNHDLAYYLSSGSVKDLGLGMYPGTHPAIAALPNGSWAVAFEANTGQLFTYNSDGSVSNTRAGMDPGTSPSIIGLHDGSYEIAGQTNTHVLFTEHVSGTGQTTNITSLGMYAGSSPSIAVQANGTDWGVAAEANTGDLVTYNNNGSISNTHVGLQLGTSPSIIPLDDNR
jgi:hypothetical protein